MKFYPVIICVLLLFLTVTNGCISYNQLLSYQNDLPDTTRMAIAHLPDIRIQPNDVLSIKVYSTDVETAAPFNLMPVEDGPGVQSLETMQLNGYLVDESGTIDFPVLGTLHLAGNKISEAKALIRDQLKEHLKEPVVHMRLLNFKVTVTGEVQNPGSFTVVNERISLPDALALAGDLTGHANRRNVLLVREKDGYGVFHHIDLQSAEFFYSDFYYLKQNDLIYVEPIRAKTGDVQDQTSKTVPIIGVAATLVAVIIGLVK